jgi:hypothetical protein
VIWRSRDDRRLLAALALALAHPAPPPSRDPGLLADWVKKNWLEPADALLAAIEEEGNGKG